jgi:hypothetical protein
MPMQAQRGGGSIGPLIRNLALEGGRWSTPRSGIFNPQEDPVPIAREAGWTSGTVWTARKISLLWDSMPGPPGPFRIGVPTALSRVPNYSCTKAMSLQKIKLHLGCKDSTLIPCYGLASPCCGLSM